MTRSPSRLLLVVLIAAASGLAQTPPPGSVVSISLQSNLTETPPTAGREFGAAVLIQDDVSLVGIPNGTGNTSNSGIVSVYRGVAGAWGQVAALKANDGSPGAAFGATLAIDGDTILIGAPSASGAGAVYVFERTAPGAFSWAQQAKITPPDLAANDDFGASVAISGDTAVIGAPRDDDGGPRTGSAYVYTRAGTVWSQEAKLSAAAPLSEDLFGRAVAVEGDRALVGAPHIDFPNSFTGFVTSFTRSGTSWSEEQVLTPTGALAGDGFGSAIALQGVHAIVGAPFNDDKGLQAGAAFVFELDGSWSQIGKFVDSAGSAGDQAGTSVAIESELIFMGAPLFDSALCPDSGAVHVGRITEVSTVLPELSIGPPEILCAPGFSTGRFGISIGTSPSLLIVGHPGGSPTVSDEVEEDAGQALVYDALDNLVQTFFDLGNSLAGTNGVAVLAGTGSLAPSAPIQMILTNAAPNALSFFFIGLTEVNAPFKGGVLVPAADVIRNVPLNGSGGFDLMTNWPSNLTTGFEFFYQVWWPDAGGPVGVAASNGLRSLVP